MGREEARDAVAGRCDAGERGGAACGPLPERPQEELVARQILEEMEKPEEESKPEESDTEGEPEEMLIVISAKRTATGYELELKRGETTIATERVPQRKDDFIQGMKRLAEKLLPLL